ncbi:unnamed protein product [Spirodela intermedia]|uniref:Uncharacterized protein n=2 Tax=Spirodela intermedia TaxID=51605 RepID=A0A7I8J2H0_SPIIN|nr:unnamed protein product [Spirodela intermedia]CAA6664003.1 unnamed protein product [Spirodela intermedia]CAA7400518.1 unnamed protein product [Spirodela intermedia]
MRKRRINCLSDPSSSHCYNFFLIFYISHSHKQLRKTNPCA